MPEDSLRGKEVMSHCLDDADEEATNGSSTGPASRPLRTFRSSSTAGGFPPASSASGLRRGSSGIGKGELASGETPGGSPNTEKKISRVGARKEQRKTRQGNFLDTSLVRRAPLGGGQARAVNAYRSYAE